jgi:hypothetical protein
MLSLDPFLQPSHMGVLGTRTSSVIVSLRSPTCFTPAMTAVGAAPCLDAGIRPHFAICFILFQFTSLSSNQQYHSPFSSVRYMAQHFGELLHFLWTLLFIFW